VDFLSISDFSKDGRLGSLFGAEQVLVNGSDGQKRR
jgi:hypothetical protein